MQVSAVQLHNLSVVLTICVRLFPDHVLNTGISYGDCVEV